MKFLIVTNDNFDALNSRFNLSNWFKKNHNIQCDIICPKGELIKSNYFETIYFDRRGVNIKNIKKINSIVEKNNYSHIIFRGVESIVIFLFLLKKKITPIFLLTGLGRVFDKRNRFGFFWRSIYRLFFKLIIFIYKPKVVLQNKNDMKDLRIKTALIMDGSGVKQEKFSTIFNEKKFNSKIIRILTASRLTKSKGIDQIIEFAEKIKGENHIEYFILGSIENLNTYYLSKIYELNSYSNISFKGFVSNTKKYYEKCHFSFFPTQYREGSPRFLIESLRSGLIIFTTDMPGCKKVISNDNGFLILSISETLKEIKKTFADKNKALEMSLNSVKLFNSVYQEKIVYSKLFKFIKDG